MEPIDGSTYTSGTPNNENRQNKGPYRVRGCYHMCHLWGYTQVTYLSIPPPFEVTYENI